ncbi:MAG: hypothetical protein ABEN55_16575, partial [Bradymonadaceae bacterium]
AINGTRCPDCVDQQTGERFIDRCETCMGTGYIEGWSDPITFRARFQSGLRKEVDLDQQTNETSRVKRQIFMTNWPILSPHDVLSLSR